jgi:hypothetical protein
MKRLLYGCKLISLRKAFYRKDFFVLTIHGQRKAGKDRHAIDQDGARPAFAGPAGLLGTRQAKGTPQGFNQRRLWLHNQFAGFIVYAKFNQSFHISPPDRFK